MKLRSQSILTGISGPLVAGAVPVPQGPPRRWGKASALSRIRSQLAAERARLEAQARDALGGLLASVGRSVPLHQHFRADGTPVLVAVCAADECPICSGVGAQAPALLAVLPGHGETGRGGKG